MNMRVGLVCWRISIMFKNGIHLPARQSALTFLMIFDVPTYFPNLMCRFSILLSNLMIRGISQALQEDILRNKAETYHEFSAFRATNKEVSESWAAAGSLSIFQEVEDNKRDIGDVIDQWNSQPKNPSALLSQYSSDSLPELFQLAGNAPRLQKRERLFQTLSNRQRSNRQSERQEAGTRERSRQKTWSNEKSNRWDNSPNGYQKRSKELSPWKQSPREYDR